MAATTEHEPTTEVRLDPGGRHAVDARFPARARCENRLGFFTHPPIRTGASVGTHRALTTTPHFFQRKHRRSTMTTTAKRKSPTAKTKRVRFETTHAHASDPNAKHNCNCQQRGFEGGMDERACVNDFQSRVFSVDVARAVAAGSRATHTHHQAGVTRLRKGSRGRTDPRMDVVVCFSRDRTPSFFASPFFPIFRARLAPETTETHLTPPPKSNQTRRQAVPQREEEPQGYFEARVEARA